MGLIAVAGFEGDLGEGLSGVPQAADVLEAGEAAELLGRCADCGTEVSFEGAEAHGGVVGDGSNGGAGRGSCGSSLPRLRSAGRLRRVRGCGWRGSVLRGGSAGVHLAGAGEDALDMVDLLGRQDVVEGYGLVVEEVGAVVQDGGGAYLGEPNDDHGGAGGVLDHAGSFLEARDDGVGETLVVQGCGAGLAQDEGEGGLGEEKLDAGVLGADPQDLAHVAAKRRLPDGGRTGGRRSYADFGCAAW